MGYIRLLLVVCACVGVYVTEADQEGFYCNPVISVNKGCPPAPDGNIQVSTELQAEHVKQLFTNISNKLLDEYESRFEAFLGTLDLQAQPRDCYDIKRLGHIETGIYKIYPRGTHGFRVRCDMETYGGGWTVIQRRVFDSDFYKTWVEYQIGFGDLATNFWLGNEQIHTITSQGWYELRVDMTGPDGQEQKYAAYNKFEVGDAAAKYKLTVDGYHGDAGDSLSVHNGFSFSTKDSDNDVWPYSCAVSFTGAWWFYNCHNSDLNGIYGSTEYGKGINWYSYTTPYKSLSRVEMKVRKWMFPPGTTAVTP